MLEINRNVSLKPYNTFGIHATASFFVDIHSAEEFSELIQTKEYQENKKLIVGGGSNILLTGDFTGLVIRNRIAGIEVVKETSDEVFLKVGGGENWHQFVMHAIAKGYGGVENLSLIPGCVGASPMQNIGAYGVEIKDVFHELQALDMVDGGVRVFSRQACKFGYRESVFKREYKDKYLIASVTFRLLRNPKINISYGAIGAELQAMGVKNPGILDVSNAVIRIRQSKLPDPALTGNAGSFFKNPEINDQQFQKIVASFPDIVSYPLEQGGYKLAAGWLIEQCGLKGFEQGGAAVHNKQALVIVNKGAASGQSVLALSNTIISKVFEKFGVQLEREVNII